jgi:iron complex outermembrane receptor protein
MMNPLVSSGAALAVTACYVFGSAPAARAADDARKPYEFPRGDAVEMLKRFADESGKQVVYLVDAVRGVTTNAVKGELTAREAVKRMVADTVLVVVEDEKTGALMINRAVSAQPSASPTGRETPPKSSSQEVSKPVRKKNLVATVVAWLALVVGPNPAAMSAEAGGTSLQDAGAITGAVSNAATGVYLEGAQVVLNPGGASALTSRDGKFSFPRVAPGSYTMTVTYAGLDAKTLPVVVRAGGTAVGDAALTAEVYQLSSFVVAGEREGNALAITQQRNAANVKNVISADAFGNVADLNLGNFLMRVPGFSTEISEGEIVRVQIRGANANLNAVSVDGTRAANGTTRTFERGFEIDKIPTDFVETVEITKAMTPDVDADSIGGAVNLKTKSALDRKGRRATYQFGQTYNVAKGTFRPLGNIGYSDLLLGGKLGVMLTASYNESHRPRDANGITWQATTDLSRPVWFNADTFGQDQVKHKRAGAGFRIDYQLNDKTRVYFNTQYSLYEDQLNRRWGRLSTPAAANIVSVTDKIVETRNQTFTFYQTLRNRDLITTNFTAGGESTAWGSKLDFNANFSPSKGTDQNRLFPQRTVAGVGFREDRTVSNNWIQLTQISGPDILDPRNSVLNSFDIPATVSRDRIFGAQINLRKPLELGVPFAFKTGGRFRAQDREQDNTRHLYSYVGPNGVAGPVGATNDDNLGRLLDGGYDYTPNSAQPKNGGLNLQGQFFNLQALQDELKRSPQLFREDLATGTRDSVRNDTKASERVSSAYLMGDLKLGRLGVVGGVRVEDTKVTGRGYVQEITPAEKARRAAWVGTVTPEETVRRTLAEYNNPTEASGHYRDFFPSLHFKYQITKGLLARASYSTGIGRPNFGQIVPTTTINNDTLTITANNPDLKPQFSKNYDLTLEYYFQPAGLLSVAGFEKKITDFIFRQSGGVLAPGNEFGEAYNGYTLTTDFNGGSARIRGLEFSYQQQFSNLPGFLKGFGAFANFTWLETKGDYGTPGSTVTQHELPNFTPRGGNLGITYIAHGWTVRALANHTGERLLAYTVDPSQRQYLLAATPIDLNVSYAVSPRLRLYVDVINVFNVGRQYQYKYVPEHRSDTWVYTTVIKAGVSGSF